MQAAELYHTTLEIKSTVKLNWSSAVEIFLSPPPLLPVIMKYYIKSRRVWAKSFYFKLNWFELN